MSSSPEGLNVIESQGNVTVWRGWRRGCYALLCGKLGGPALDHFPGSEAPVLPQPVAPAPQAPLGINPDLFQRARAALDMHRIAARDFIGIADFSLASSQSRFHVVDLRNGQVDSYRVAHGQGSDPAHSGYLERFSNDFGSHATSNGAYTTGDYYNGKYGLSMKTNGLDWSNSNADARAIVIHNAWYAEPETLAQHGKLGRSLGCFAFAAPTNGR